MLSNEKLPDERLALIQAAYDQPYELVDSLTFQEPRLLQENWPFSSVMLWGRYMNGPLTLGRTDDYLRGVRRNPTFNDELTQTERIEIGHIFSTIYFATGVAANEIVEDQTIFDPILKPATGN